MYNKLVFYLEACESGSMFENILKKDIKVYATTAAKPDESSWATYCDPDDRVNGKSIGSCLGDEYSVNWIENAEAQSNKQETLSGNMSIQKRIETFNATLSFKNYTPNQNDYDIMNDITISIEPFLVWLCGGKFGDNFRVARRNWLLKDVYNVQAIDRKSVV